MISTTEVSKIEADNTSVSLIAFNPWNHATIDCGNGFKYIDSNIHMYSYEIEKMINYY